MCRQSSGSIWAVTDEWRRPSHRRCQRETLSGCAGRSPQVHQIEKQSPAFHRLQPPSPPVNWFPVRDFVQTSRGGKQTSLTIQSNWADPAAARIQCRQDFGFKIAFVNRIGERFAGDKERNTRCSCGFNREMLPLLWANTTKRHCEFSACMSARGQFLYGYPVRLEHASSIRNLPQCSVL